MNRIIEIPAELSILPITVNAEVSTEEISVMAKIGVALSASPTVYDGETTVIPSSQDQTLETQGLLMPDDVNVKRIPFMAVSNDSGGMTATIGG